MQNFLKGHAVVRDYFATKGVLLEMSGALWQKIPFQDEIPSGSLTLRTRVEVKDVPGPGQVRIAVRPLPGIEYRRVVPFSSTPEHEAKVLRRALNREGNSKRFVYSTVQGKRANLRRSIVVPRAFFTKNADAKSLGKGVGVVLLPRHFLTSEPAVSLGDLVTLGRKAKSAVTVADLETTEGSDSGILFYVPDLLEKIRTKTEEWWYHDRIEDIAKWQGSLLKLGMWESLSDGEIKWMEFFHKLYVTDGLEERAWDRLKNDGEVRERLTQRLKAGELHLPPGQEQSPGHRLPSDLNWEEMFENLLRQVDADYLLLGLDEKSRRTLDAAADQWAATVAEIPKREYWPSDKLDLCKVKELVSRELRGAFESHRDDEVQSWCHDALVSFSGNSKFVLRSVIENMQRMVLAGLPATPIAVESRNGTLRRWRALLRTILNARLVPSNSEKQCVYGVDFSDDESQLGADRKWRPSDLMLGSGADIGELCEMVRPLRGSVEVETYRAFFERVNQMEPEDVGLWQGVVDELNKKTPAFGWEVRVKKALKLCRSAKAHPASKPFTDDLFRKLCRLFA